METSKDKIREMPVVSDQRNFDASSGNALERLVFNYRLWFVAVCVVITAFFGLRASTLTVNAGFDKMIPQNHPYIQNFFENRSKLGGLGNIVRIVVENTRGDVFDPAFLEVTRQINDAIFLMPGVERSFIRSIWMASVRWTEVTEEGFRGGQVMPEDYDGSARTIAELRTGIRRAGIVGSLVSNDYKSIEIVVPLLEKNMETGERLDYGAYSRQLEKEIRQKYESQGADGKGPQVKIHIVGFAKLVGDLIEGLMNVTTYFGIAFVISALIIFSYTRCLRSTLLVLGCSLLAVVWAMGIVKTLHIDLDPYSILVPFLVFAIGVSHGAQKMNGIMQDVGRGTNRYVAARYTFRRLFLAGVTALLADAVAFIVLTVIDIPVIKELALVASIGVAVLILTNLLLLPVMLSYVGVSPAAAARSLSGEGSDHSFVWRFLHHFTEKRWASGAILVSAVLAAGGYAISLHLKTGDLDPGAPELRADSRYNRDVAYINGHYGLSSDEFVAIVKTPRDGCQEYKTVKETERFAWTLRQVPGVQYTMALSDNIAKAVAGSAEGNPKWLSIPNNPSMIGAAVERVLNDSPDAVDKGCSTIPVIAYLTDHKAETLTRIVTTVEGFAQQHDDKDIHFLLAAGPAGIEAAINIVVEKASRTMLYYVYGAVILLCFITFRNWRAVIVAIIPLMITSVLCEALMVMLGIGVKVATLPVIALGVGIGVDYALYLLSVQLSFQRAGMPLAEAYKAAAAFTGKVVALVGVTLAAGVVTWAWSPIKFQADMGILLTFMFLWNMVGALILVPALSCFLLKNPQHVGR